ncbi:hypothetical protein [Chryseobacterium viscerum]|uniref:Uncharacterized protein n=1 Tax=Chryseobacterium viscerum TaxID=1037377 RepID=A0A316WSS4_9FLAO|nr:hypothetical protein [Chryseobacterium viscerum]PWN64199.1 hypothetical protein C1634_006280 [Chryseobacterium viscerum]
MLTNKKYKSDKVVIPLLGILVVALFFIPKVYTAYSLIVFVIILLGIIIFRYLKENSKKWALYNILGLIAAYLIIALYENLAH